MIIEIDGIFFIACDDRSVVFNKVGNGEEKDNSVELTWKELAELVLNDACPKLFWDIQDKNK